MFGWARLAPALAALSLGLCVLLAPGLDRTPAGAQVRLETFARGELTIETAAGARHRFRVELALTPAQQAQGLMYRRRLPADAGMLFLYGNDAPVSMWMRNTLIPLDMLFIGRDGRIVHVAERTVPGSLETISAGRPVAGVLELNGGTAARLRIRVGDRVLHPAFGTAP
ncbi:MAG: DUF192 domain-containing protein [Kiloniellaceae bacterium]